MWWAARIAPSENMVGLIWTWMADVAPQAPGPEPDRDAGRPPPHPLWQFARQKSFGRRGRRKGRLKRCPWGNGKGWNGMGRAGREVPMGGNDGPPVPGKPLRH